MSYGIACTLYRLEACLALALHTLRITYLVAAPSLGLIRCLRIRTCIHRCISLYIYIYMYMLPLNRVFGVENLGLEMCMDESLGHRYLSLAASHGSGLADRRSPIQQSYLHPSSVKKANQSVKGKSPGHGYSQSQK